MINITKFHPIIWLFCFVLNFMSLAVLFSPYSLLVKGLYIAFAYSLSYIAIVFEAWRLEDNEPDYKALLEEGEPRTRKH